MKKLFLSSIIMLAVCSFATAQNSDLRAAKTAKKATPTPTFTNAAAAKPEKAAIKKTDASVVKTKEDGTAAPKADALRTDDLKAKPSATSADVKAEKKAETVKPAPDKKG